MKMRYKYKKVWNYINFIMDNLGMKFKEYKLDINKVVACCNTMK